MVNKNGISIKHVVEVPRCGCLFGTAKDANGKTRIYLLFQHKGRIYSRNGLKGTWEELEAGEGNLVRDLIDRTVGDKSVPRYSTNSQLAFQN